jgi:hypothetical protein
MKIKVPGIWKKKSELNMKIKVHGGFVSQAALPAIYLEPCSERYPYLVVPLSKELPWLWKEPTDT